MTGGELADVLRSWRRRAQPPALAQGVRRVPGLRREELAERAGISVDYLVRLEQGRALRPSGQVLAALARALGLESAERDVLFAAAGLLPPETPLLSRNVGRATRRLVERTVKTPIAVFSRAWDLLLANELWLAVFGPITGTSAHAGNLLWQHVVERNRPVLHSERAEKSFTRRLMWDLRREAARHPADSRLADLRRQLDARLEFDASEPPAQPLPHERLKSVRHPRFGTITFAADVLLSPDDDTWIMMYTVEPGSVDARKLDAVRAGLDGRREAVAG